MTAPEMGHGPYQVAQRDILPLSLVGTSVSSTWPVEHVNFLQTKKERNYFLYRHLSKEIVTYQKTIEIRESNSYYIITTK